MKQETSLKTQNEIAEILGISKSQLSKLISSKFHVSPKEEIGNKKLYEYKEVEKLYQDYKNNLGKRANSRSDRKVVTKTSKSESSLLVSQLREEVSFLKKELETKQVIINKKDQQLKDNAETVANLANKLAKLADQSQQLNLIDKPGIVSKVDEETLETEETKQEKGNKETKKSLWSRIFKR